VKANGPAVCEIGTSQSRAWVCPELGGAVARFHWRGRSILRDAPDAAIFGRKVEMMGCFPLVPFSNRIGQARFRFEGREYRLRPNFPPEPHAIHGVGWRRRWDLVAHEAPRVELALEHLGDEDWPFPFSARQTVTIGEDSLGLALEIANTGERPMPAGLGFHPYFNLLPSTKLEARWEGCWLAGPDKLPSLWTTTPPDCDFGSVREAGSWSVDRCFTGWDRIARLEYGTHSVRITASEELSRIVCFAPGDGRAFIALEPVSHVNDPFALAERGFADTGLRRLDPGERLLVRMDIRALEGRER
jgi:aldose 1-epimerase